MQTNILTDVFLPLALAFIMLGMGMSLVLADFKRIFVYPKAIVTGLILQILFLPLLALGLNTVFGLTGSLAIGIMILSACPGGATSNLISHLSNGDTALSISLTAFSSVITIITIPLIVNFALQYYGEEGSTLRLPVLKTILQVFVITLIPVFIGMFIRKRNFRLAVKSEKPVKFLSALFLFLIIFAAIVKEKENVIEFFQLAGPVALSLNLLSLVIPFLLARLLLISGRQSVTLAIESGIQNGTLGIFVAATLLKMPEMTIPPAIYSLIMFVTATVIIILGNKFYAK
ncbi:MAG: bile acid:sodium symporter family protein [Luteibaculaceae bacterium]